MPGQGRVHCHLPSSLFSNQEELTSFPHTPPPMECAKKNHTASLSLAISALLSSLVYITSVHACAGTHMHVM